jgi:hypothetical protein
MNSREKQTNVSFNVSMNFVYILKNISREYSNLKNLK